jgi:membrane associated rhomboid family serine protease
MGLYDRDYYRDTGDEPSYRPGPSYGGGRPYGRRPIFASLVNQLILVNAVLYFFDVLVLQSGPGKPGLMLALAVKPDTLVQPLLWWQFLTAGFAHSTLHFSHILFNMFGLWMFGRELEQKLGRWEFLRFYLLAIVIGNVAWAAREYVFMPPNQWAPLLGASGGVTAVLILFAVTYPQQRVLLFFAIPAPAWTLCVLVVLINVFGANSAAEPGASRVAYDVHLVGAAFGFLYHHFGWNFGRLLGGLSLSSLASARKLRIHDPDSNGRYAKLDEQADQILAKLHREGEGSLTAKERRLLEAYSRRMQQKRQ